MYDDKCKEVLISEEELKKRVAEMGAEITKDYEGKDLVIIGVLIGSFIFMADLVREIKLPMNIDFMVAKSYMGTNTTGEVRILKDVVYPVAGKDVLIVEDVVDSGFTLSKVKEHFKNRGATSVKICAAFDKPSRRVVDNLNVDYKGFVIPDKFIVGYGLDCDEEYRNIKDIRIFNP